MYFEIFRNILIALQGQVHTIYGTSVCNGSVTQGLPELGGLAAAPCTMGQWVSGGWRKGAGHGQQWPGLCLTRPYGPWRLKETNDRIGVFTFIIIMRTEAVSSPSLGALVERSYCTSRVRVRDQVR